MTRRDTDHCDHCEPVQNRVAIVEQLIDENESIEDQVVDLLTNLRHFAEAYRLEGENIIPGHPTCSCFRAAFDAMLRRSSLHWEEERHGGGSHGE